MKLKKIIKTKLLSIIEPTLDFENIIISNYVNIGVVNALKFNFYDYKIKVLGFLEKMRCGEFEYKYSASCKLPNLYSSIYACMTLGLLGAMSALSKNQKTKWAEYFDFFQNSEDGLFYDARLRNELYDNTDWWGARHLSALILMAYNYLGCKPKHSFKFLKKEESLMQDKINATNWNSPISNLNDIDNYLMNILIMLIHERDYNGNFGLSKNIEDILNILTNLVNEKTGMWGQYDKNNPHELSRMIQFYYHLLPIYLYEVKINTKSINQVIDYTLHTQNSLGGFGVALNSSACEDIDSIYILINLVKRFPQRDIDVNKSILKAFAWVLANQNEDGGFVFKRNFPFEYGHKQMSALKNESEMHSTWFRTLSLAFITKYMKIENHFELNNNLLNYSYLI